jgi:PhoPQ-activated pathogenicity-related protein
MPRKPGGSITVSGRLFVRQALLEWRHPLLRYLSRRDDAYTWSRAGEVEIPSMGNAVRLHLLSQVWQGVPWKHELALYPPARPQDGSIALLLVTGDRGDLPTLALMARAARLLQVPAAVLFDVPNQPLFGGKSEDALIAHTFLECLRSGDRSWPLLYPMVKGVVRAMDAIQEFAAREWRTEIAGFVVTGASKRGWTTWLTGASDRRVVGIAPLVYDNLNVTAQMAHQVAVYGSYSEEVSDYSAVGLPQKLDTPQGRKLANVVDPFLLRDRLEIPKLMIHGSNDRYWTLESANLYFDELPGDKHILYVPNSGHRLAEMPRVLSALGAFVDACATGRTLARLEWSCNEAPDGLRLAIAPEHAPERVTIWTAAAETRDFRDALWRARRITGRGGRYEYLLPRPSRGYAALFGEVAYRWARGTYAQSTTPHVVAAIAS